MKILNYFSLGSGVCEGQPPGHVHCGQYLETQDRESTISFKGVISKWRDHGGCGIMFSPLCVCRMRRRDTKCDFGCLRLCNPAKFRTVMS